MKQKTYNKLVRDKIPKIIESRGAVPITRMLDDEEFSEALNKKLIEEMEEFLLSYDIEELVDIYEVLLTILYTRGISFDEFEKIRHNKTEERGTFKEKVFLISVEE